MSPGQVYVGRSWGYVGVCWGHVHPSWGYLGAWLTLRRWFWAKLFSWLHLHSQILLEKAPASGLRVSCLDSLSKICLFLSSPQWPASFTFRSFLLPPVACESQVPPIEEVGGTAWSPISKAKICLSDGAAGFKGYRPDAADPFWGGVLPVCLGLPVAATDHLDRGRKILRGCRGTVMGWSNVDAQDPDTNIWNKLPAVLLVCFETPHVWQVDGLPPNTLPIAPVRSTWYLDAGRTNPQLAISRRQFPL